MSRAPVAFSAHGAGPADQLWGPAPLPPLEHNTTTLQEAISRGTLGVGYSGSGMLLFYFIGVSKVLQQLGVIDPGRTRVAATSGGILGCAPDFGIVSHEGLIRVGKEFVTRCHERHNCAGILDDEVSRVVDKVLPPNAAEIVNGTVFITYATPDADGVPRGRYVHTYDSREALHDAIRTGVYLPMWSGPSMTRLFNGLRAFDGGFRRQLPCPPDVTYCVTVSALPPWDWRELITSLTTQPTVRLLQRALSSTLGASPLLFLRTVLLRNGLSGYSFAEVANGAVAYFSSVTHPGRAEIYPGKYNRNPFKQWEWITRMLIPPTHADIDVLVDMGERDAWAWAREHGLTPQAGRKARRALQG